MSEDGEVGRHSLTRSLAIVAQDAKGVSSSVPLDLMSWTSVSSRLANLLSGLHLFAPWTFGGSSQYFELLVIP